MGERADLGSALGPGWRKTMLLRLVDAIIWLEIASFVALGIVRDGTINPRKLP
jgi:hypothetical protein